MSCPGCVEQIVDRDLGQSEEFVVTVSVPVYNLSTAGVSFPLKRFPGRLETLSVGNETQWARIKPE